MDKYGLYFMIHSIDTVRGGMTRAALIRASMLRHFYDEIGIITFDFNPDYDKVIHDLENANLWNENIQHVNVYEFLMGNDHKDNVLRNDFELDIDLYNKEEVFDRHGRLRKIVLADKQTRNIVQEYFFTANGQCFLKRQFDPVSNKTLRCTWYKPNGGKQEFSKVKDYRNFFIESIVERHEGVVLLSDGRFSDRVLFAANHPKIARVALIHSNHLQFPYHYGSNLVKRNEELLKNLYKLDAFVTLTERQADDIRNRFGHISTIHVIGHPAPFVHAIKQDYEPYTAVIVSRYSGIKQIPHSIKAFKKVIKKVPTARLEIWGFGDQEKLYRQLICKLNLENHVYIKGFTKNVQAVFERAAFSLVTSKSEAFAMSIVESMSVGTPVICYECNYGPTDLVKHEVNGLLIEPNDINGLANAMVELFLNKQKRQALSVGALKISEQYSQEKTAQKWVNVFEHAMKQKDQRVKLKGMSASLISLFYVKEENSFLLKGKLFLHDNLFSSYMKQHINLSLQLRKRKHMEDFYVPLQFVWDDENDIKFYGKVSNFGQCKPGLWDFNLSFSCLNDCQFVKMNGVRERSYESMTYRMNRLKFKLYASEQSVQMRIFRSNEKRRIQLRAYRDLLVSKYKQKVKEQMTKMRLLK